MKNPKLLTVITAIFLIALVTMIAGCGDDTVSPPDFGDARVAADTGPRDIAPRDVRPKWDTPAEDWPGPADLTRPADLASRDLVNGPDLPGQTDVRVAQYDAAPLVCVPGLKECQGASIMKCADDGMSWLVSTTCPEGQVCVGLECVDISGWATYQNEEARIRFRYPSEDSLNEKKHDSMTLSLEVTISSSEMEESGTFEPGAHLLVFGIYPVSGSFDLTGFVRDMIEDYDSHPLSSIDTESATVGNHAGFMIITSDPPNYSACFVNWLKDGHKSYLTVLPCGPDNEALIRTVTASVEYY